MKAALTAISLVCLAWVFMPPAAAAPAQAAAIQAAAPADYFQFPLPAWSEHCLGFGSQWRYCDGTVLRRCSGSGAIWLHTGFDAVTGIAPVMAAANGVIAGYTVDPTFKGGMLIRHSTVEGVVLTQYWHVWPRAGFRVGTAARSSLTWPTWAHAPTCISPSTVATSTLRPRGAAPYRRAPATAFPPFRIALSIPTPSCRRASSRRPRRSRTAAIRPSWRLSGGRHRAQQLQRLADERRDVLRLP